MTASRTMVHDVPPLAVRRRDAHKGDFGRVLIVGGSVGMAGAPALAANAALRSGAGRVRIAAPEPIQPIVAGLAPCATSIPLASTTTGHISSTCLDAFDAIADDNDVIAIGPGVGQSDCLRKIVLSVIGRPDKPTVIDADGLNNLAAISEWWSHVRARLVLTPHPGEMRRLLGGANLPDIIEDRSQVAAQFAERTGTICVLKGSGTVVTDGRRVYVNDTGNPGMATAGSGDVLTGIIAALIGQGLSPFEAAVKGVHVHGLSGDLAADRVGEIALIATDLIDALPAAFRTEVDNGRRPA